MLYGLIHMATMGVKGLILPPQINSSSPLYELGMAKISVQPLVITEDAIVVMKRGSGESSYF